MTERKRDHIATIALVVVLVLIAMTYYMPAAIFFSAIIMSAMSLPIVLWNVIRAVL